MNIRKRTFLFKSFTMKMILIGITSIGQIGISYAHSQIRISIKEKEKTIKEVLRIIETKANLNIFYNDRDIDASRKIAVDLTDKTIAETLDEVLKETSNHYKIDGNQIYITKKAAPSPSPSVNEKTDNTVRIRGTITDEKGEALIGVSIMEKGTLNGTVSDIDGNFEIVVGSRESVLVFSYIGYNTYQYKVENKSEINVVLSEDVVSLQEVVIIGYGKQKRESVTAAIAAIESKDLVQSPQANISNSLVGRLPGLLAVQRSGQPGEDQTTLRVRGTGTFSGSSDPLVIVDGIEGVNYNSIDPNEIESLSILKDASATAVFGVRGANGVVIITTKRGTIGKPQVSLTSNFALTQFTRMRNTVDAYKYVKGYNEALKYDSFITGTYIPKFTEEQIEKFRTGEDPLFYPNVDWTKFTYKPLSSQMQHNLTIRGGVEGVKYFTSVGYFDQHGQFSDQIVHGIKEYNAQPRFKRYNFRSNFDFNITKSLSAVLNISNQTEIRQGNTGTINRVIELATKASPIWSPGLWDDKLIYLEDGPASVTTPVDQLLRSGYNRGYRNYLNALLRLDYKLDAITEGLSAHGSISYINMNSQDAEFSNIKLAYIPRRLPEGEVVFIPQGEEPTIYFKESVAKYRREYAELGINYSRTFGRHSVGSLVLYNQSKLHDPNLQFVIPQGYQGLVGRVTYRFDGRYMAEYNLGYNGTENFAPGKRFGFFPAYSLGWVVSQEPYFPENDVLSYLKIRGSYGEVGNDKIGGDRFLYLPSSYTYQNHYHFGSVGTDYNAYPVANEGKIGNPDVTWERAKKMNVGAEINFWNNKIRIVADLFNEKRDNILAPLGTVPTIVGATLPAFNLGKMKNSGFDGEIAFNNRYQNFDYWVKANYTYARNLVEFKDEPTPIHPYLAETGQRFGQYFGMIFEGFYNTWEEVNDPNRPVSSWNANKIQPGDVKYRDVNSDGILDLDDMVPVGYSNFPEITFGLSLGGSYKGFDFSVLFQGADNVSVSYSRHARYGYREDAAVPNYILERSWTQERYEKGLPIEFPHLSVGDVSQKHNYIASNLWIRDAGYIRLKNVEIGYTLKKRFLNCLRLNSARIFLNGNNLFTWSQMLPGIDPESNVAKTSWEPYPLVRVFNWGLNINF